MMTRVRWDILDEQSKAIKAVLDIADVPRIFIEKRKGQEGLKTENTIDNVEDLKKMGVNNKTIQHFFGDNSEQQQLVKKIMLLYSLKLKDMFQLPIRSYQKVYKFPLPDQILQRKLKQLIQATEILNEIISNKKTKFICGNTVTIIDLIFYFHLCNVVYFRRNPSEYPNIMKWFGRVYKIKEVKAITHQWFSMAKQITRNFGKIKSSPKL